MTIKYSHPVELVNLHSMFAADYVDWVNITGAHDVDDDGPAVFDTGGNMGVVIAAEVTGAISGTDPVLRIRVDHSVDGITFEQLHEFTSWSGAVGFRTFSVPTTGGPLVCAQYLRIMAKLEGASAVFTNLIMKASLKG